MIETLLQMKIAEFEAALVILASKEKNKEKSTEIAEFLEKFRNESGILINKMEMSE